MRTTLKAINQALKQATGRNIELVKGAGYFYFRGDGAERFREAGVYGMPKLGSDKAFWVRELLAKIEEAA